MSTPASPDQDHETAPPVPVPVGIAEPNFSGSPLPIEDFAGRVDFPKCTRGAYIDIRGFAGIVVDIVNQSIKVRSAEGITQSFNSHRLKSLYAPATHPEPMPSTPHQDRPEPAPRAEVARPVPVAPPRIYIAAPDFTAAIQPIREFAGQPDFPRCIYGKHVDIQGNTGVVVEIVKGSLKIQSPTGTTLSYNAEVLRKLYGQA
jgi:hypothetical protein